MYPIALIAAGAILLLFGRRLFWLFCAVIGFLLGTMLAPLVVPGASETLVLGAGIVFGLLGAGLGSTVRGIAVGIAGFAGGALAIQQIMNYMGVSAASIGVPNWVVLIVGGIIGILVLSALFDWALIFLSAITGAGFVVQGLTTLHVLPNSYSQIGFIALLVIGVLAQVTTNRMFYVGNPEAQPRHLVMR